MAISGLLLHFLSRLVELEVKESRVRLVSSWEINVADPKAPLYVCSYFIEQSFPEDSRPPSRADNITELCRQALLHHQTLDKAFVITNAYKIKEKE